MEEGSVMVTLSAVGVTNFVEADDIERLGIAVGAETKVSSVFDLLGPLTLSESSDTSITSACLFSSLGLVTPISGVYSVADL